MYWIFFILPTWAGDCLISGTAVAPCRLACDASDPAACQTLGYLLETGMGVPQPPRDPNEVRFHGELDEKYGGTFAPPPEVRDLAGAMVAYAKACTLGSPDGCLSHGVLQKLEGDLGEATENFEKAFSGWTTSCEAGVGRHCQLMAAAWWGNWGHASDPATSYTWSVRACDLKDGRGCWAQGGALLEGRGVKRDLPQAERLLQRSCNALKEVVGCLALQELYGPEGAKSDPALEMRYDARICSLDPKFCRDQH